MGEGWRRWCRTWGIEGRGSRGEGRDGGREDQIGAEGGDECYMEEGCQWLNTWGSVVAWRARGPSRIWLRHGEASDVLALYRYPGIFPSTFTPVSQSSLTRFPAGFNRVSKSAILT